MKQAMRCSVPSLTLADLAAVDGGMPRSYAPPSSSSSQGLGNRAMNYAHRAQDAMYVVNTGRQVYETGRQLGHSWTKHTGLSGRETVDALLSGWGKRE